MRVVFKLRDKSGEELKGTWYQELQEIKRNRYLVEEVFRKRISKEGDREFLVKWKGWPEKFNTWVPTTDLERLK